MANTCSATSSATCCSTCVATCGQCESTITQRMNSSAACATSCAMSTEDESNQSAAGMQHHTAVGLPHSSCMLGLHCTVLFLQPKNLPLPVGESTPHRQKVIYWLTRLTTPNDIIGVHIGYCTSIATRRRSESAYIHQVNFFYSFYIGLGGRWCPVKTESLSPSPSPTLYKSCKNVHLADICTL